MIISGQIVGGAAVAISLTLARAAYKSLDKNHPIVAISKDTGRANG